MNYKKLLIGFVLLSIPNLLHADPWSDQFIVALKNGAVFVEDDHGTPLIKHRIEDSFIPASIIKLATAACALETLGANYRFNTDFYLTSDQDLHVKGYGDPLLISREIESIAGQLKEEGVYQIRNVILDYSYFDSHIQIDGIARSKNPYDALNAALLANFNTLHVRRLKKGGYESAEAETPLTPTAYERIKKLKVREARINLGVDARKAAVYFGELLTVFLKQKGVLFTGKMDTGVVPDHAQLILRHESSSSLTEIIKDMLNYSTNLTANQIFLVVGAKKYGAPATVDKGVRALSAFLREQMGWNHFSIAEGSGLSRNTNVTPKDMMQLVRYWEKYESLLPIKQQLFRAKTGTLNGVTTLAGFFDLPGGEHARMVLMINDPTSSYSYKFLLARKLYEHFNGVETGTEIKDIISPWVEE